MVIIPGADCSNHVPDQIETLKIPAFIGGPESMILRFSGKGRLASEKPQSLGTQKSREGAQRQVKR